MYLLFSFGCMSDIVAQGRGHGQCQVLPMRSADITYSMDTNTTKHHHPLTSFVISSNNNHVYSLASGKIIKGPNIHNYETVGISMNDNDTIITYLMLKEVAVKTGDVVKKGDLIGIGTPNDKTGKNESAILVKVLAKGITLTDQDAMSFIKRRDN